MSENAAAATRKKKAKSVTKKPNATPSYTEVSEMVNDAIKSLENRGGCSFQAIKKHIGSHHKVDLDQLNQLIKKYLKSAVARGTLIQTKGKGARGSFKLSVSGQKTKVASKAVKVKNVANKILKTTKPECPKLKNDTSEPFPIRSWIYPRFPKDQSLFLYLFPVYQAKKRTGVDVTD